MAERDIDGRRMETSIIISRSQGVQKERGGERFYDQRSFFLAQGWR